MIYAALLDSGLELIGKLEETEDDYVFHDCLRIAVINQQLVLTPIVSGGNFQWTTVNVPKDKILVGPYIVHEALEKRFREIVSGIII